MVGRGQLCDRSVITRVIWAALATQGAAAPAAAAPAHSHGHSNSAVLHSHIQSGIHRLKLNLISSSTTLLQSCTSIHRATALLTVGSCKISIYSSTHPPTMPPSIHPPTHPLVCRSALHHHHHHPHQVEYVDEDQVPFDEEDMEDIAGECRGGTQGVFVYCALLVVKAGLGPRPSASQAVSADWQQSTDLGD